MAKRENKVEGVNGLPDLELGVNGIKGLFKAGAVPREADYAKLIEYVHYLHKLLGIEAEDGSPGLGLGVGFKKEDDSVLGVDVEVLAGGGLTSNGSVFNVGEGKGITVDTDTVSLDAESAAGLGLTGSDGVINVGVGLGLDLSDNYVALAPDSWKYMFAKLYGASQWASTSMALVFFTRMTSFSVLARGITIGGTMFGDSASQFSWNGKAPDNAYSSLDRNNFTFTFEHGAGEIGGEFTVIISLGSGTQDLVCQVVDIPFLSASEGGQ